MKDKYQKMKELEEIATQLTGIKPIYDKEYQAVTYVKGKISYDSNLIIQNRSKVFKSSKRHL